MQLATHQPSLLPVGRLMPSRPRRNAPVAPRCFQGSNEEVENQPKKSIEQITSSQPSAAEPGGRVGALDPTRDVAAAAQRSDHESHGEQPKPMAPGRKKSIEEITGSQPSAAEPGGKVGGMDPTQGAANEDSGSASTSAEFEVDADLADALRPLLLHTRARLQEQHQGTAPSAHAIAAAAVAAAEASGALPPLAGPQRSAVEAFFSKLADSLGDDEGRAEADDGMESFGSSGGEALEGEDDAVLRIRPHTRELLDAVVNSHLADHGAPHRSRMPSDSVRSGGEVGNISLQSDTHGSGEVEGVPAEGSTERTERQAEADFEQLELSDLPHASPSDLEEQRRWAQRSAAQRAGHAAIEGDAPAAGDGLQVAEEPVEAGQGGTSEDSSSME